MAAYSSYPPSPAYTPKGTYPPSYPSTPKATYPNSYPPSPQPQATYPQTPSPQSYPSSPFAAVVPSPGVVFPPGTDPNAITCFNLADEDKDGIINDRDLQKGLSLYGHVFNNRTIHLLLTLYTDFAKVKKIGPAEFVPLYVTLQGWKSTFEKFDQDRSGLIDARELGSALASNGYAVTPSILQLLVTKFGKGSGNGKAVEYSYFIECFLTVKGLTDKFKEKDTTMCGSVTFTYESFLLTVIPFMTA